MRAFVSRRAFRRTLPLALPALCALAAVPAHATFSVGAGPGTIDSSTPGLYSLGLSETDSLTTDLSGNSVYQYNYTATLTSVSSGADITAINFNNIQGYDLGSAFVGAESTGLGFGSIPPVEQMGTVGFQAPGFPGSDGLTSVGQSVTFSFDSFLPPTGSISASANSPISNNAIATGTILGPGPASNPGGVSNPLPATDATSTTTDPTTGAVTYTFSGITSGTWVDPAASGYIYTIDTGSPDFSSITLPTSIPLSGTDFTVDYSSTSAQDAEGASQNFGTGVSSFSITGIDPSYTGAFPVQFFFEGGGAGTFTQTSIPAALPSTPEPSSVASMGLGACGLLGLMLRARKRRGVSA